MAPNFLTLSAGQQAILIVDSCLSHAKIFFPRGPQNKKYQIRERDQERQKMKGGQREKIMPRELPQNSLHALAPNFSFRLWTWDHQILWFCGFCCFVFCRLSPVLAFQCREELLVTLQQPCFTFTFNVLGPYMDPHCGLHNSVWRHVCKDLESACYLQERKDEEEGEKWAFKACQIQDCTPSTSSSNPHGVTLQVNLAKNTGA